MTPMNRLIHLFVVIIAAAILAFVILQYDLPRNNSQVASRITNSTPGNCSGEPIIELTEGPYYKAGSAELQDITTENTAGTRLILEGYVYNTDCQPLKGAWIDFWQADGNGEYDNVGYNLRGHQFTDEAGKYKLITVIPGLYTGRTEHIHFKIRASESSNVYTSQLFFPDAAANQTDSIYDESMIIKIEEDGDGKKSSFDIVVP